MDKIQLIIVGRVTEAYQTAEQPHKGLSTFKDSVWYDYQEEGYLFDDTWFDNKDIKSILGLLNEGFLIDKGIQEHQGRKMKRYQADYDYLAKIC